MSESASRIGKLFGHYRIEAKIGGGAFSTVYRAVDEHLKRQVAIKIFSDGESKIKTSPEEFSREASAIAKLDSPLIAKIYDLVNWDGVVFLVMELVPGDTLEAKLKSGALPIKEVVTLGTQLAQGLHDVHKIKIVHGDIKPSNLQVTSAGFLKILDFGLARPNPETEETSPDINKGVRNTISGTARYLAPEVWNGQSKSKLSDIWAVGVVLYEMACGKRPFEGPDAISLAPETPTTINPKIPESLEKIILKALTKNLTERYQTAEQMAKDFAACLTGPQEPPVVGSAVLPADAEEQTRLRMIALQKFSLTWLLWDQLPGGGWGRSLTPWMEENWKGSSLHADSVIEDDGGFESSVFAFQCYHQTVLRHVGSHPDDKILTSFKRYLRQHQDPQSGGFGAKALQQAGLAVNVTLRHTALGAFALLLLNQTEKSVHNGEITKALRYIFSRTTKEYGDERNGALLYMLVLYLSGNLKSFDCYSPSKSIAQAAARCYKDNEAAMRPAVIKNEYKPIPSHPDDGDEHCYPFFIPYGRFVRMTTYTFLSCCQFLTDSADFAVKQRMAEGIKTLATDYLASYNGDERRFVGGDTLRPRARGVKPWVSKFPEPPQPDIGCTAMFLAVICNPQLMNSLDIQQFTYGPRQNLKDCSPQSLATLLLSDLVDLFDRHLIDPSLYRYSYSVTVSALLLATTTNVAEPSEKGELSCQTEQEIRFAEGLSEQSINQYVEDVLFQKHEPLPTQIFARSLSRLLVDTVRPGRYPEGKFDFDAQGNDSYAHAVMDKTLRVYRDAAFVEKFRNVWQTRVMTGIPDMFIQMCQGAEGAQPRLLDLGCGVGQYAREFQAKNFEVTLLDGSPPMLKVASTYIGRDLGDPLNKLLDIRKLDKLTSESFDAVWCSGTMIHLPRSEATSALKELKRILVHNGTLMVNVAINNPRLEATDGRFFAYWRDRASFAELIITAGFSIEKSITSFVRVNTYSESGMEIQWETFLCKAERPVFSATVAASELTGMAYDLIVRRFTEEHGNGEQGKLVDWVAERLGSVKSNAILDAGCGPGHVTKMFANKNFEAFGVDISVEMIKSSRERYPDCNFEICDFRDLERFPGEKFACVFCLAAFQHIPRQDDTDLKTLRGFKRILCENGMVMLTVQIGRASGFEPDGRFTEAYGDKDQAIRRLREAGFEVVDAAKDVDEYTLSSGRNSFHRNLKLHFANILARRL